MKLHSNNGLYTDEIVNILESHGQPINGIFSRDKLPIQLDSGWYIVNLQGATQGDRKGTHWVTFKVTPHGIAYFDAFGFPPFLELLERYDEKPIFYSSKEIQDYNSTCCGYFCIAAILSDSLPTTPDKTLKRFIYRFSDDTANNDSILAKLLTHYGV
jgi:hypothetical protein